MYIHRLYIYICIYTYPTRIGLGFSMVILWANDESLQGVRSQGGARGGGLPVMNDMPFVICPNKENKQKTSWITGGFQSFPARHGGSPDFYHP